MTENSPAGKICPGCGQEILPGQQAVACPTCGAVQHADCWTRAGGCSAEGCPTGVKNAAPVQSAPVYAEPTAAPTYAPAQPAYDPAGGYTPAPAYKAPKKKSNMGLIIGIAAVAVVAVVVLVIVLMGGGLKSVELAKSSLSLEAGDVYTLKYEIDPDDYDAEDVEWSTSDSSVATVRDGKVTAVGAGSCEITLEVDGKKDTCDVTVTLPAETRYVVGKWTLDSVYDSSDKSVMNASSWGWKITLNADGTGVLTTSDSTGDITWQHNKTDEEGYATYIVTMSGGDQLAMGYDPSDGNLYLLVGDYLLTFGK